MSYKLRFWLGLIILTSICWIDYQYFSEGYTVRAIPDITRKLMHVLFLIMVIPIGYWGWARHPLPWIKSFWLIIYTSVLILLLIFGLIDVLGHPFSPELKDVVSKDIRLFFTSPMPYLILFLISILSQRELVNK